MCPSSNSFDPAPAGPLLEALEDWEISLRARAVSPKTLEAYIPAVTQLKSYLDRRHVSDDIAMISRAHVQGYLAGLTDAGRKPGTVHARYRALNTFFTWLTDRAHAIPANPMADIEPPILVETPMPLLTKEQLNRLIDSLAKDRTFQGIRDHALVLFMIDTGARRSEVCGMKYTPKDAETNDILDLRQGLIRLYGKGRKQRIVHVGARTADALARYRRARAKIRQGYRQEFWLTVKGPLLPNTLYQIVKNRGKAIGIEGLRPHLFRNYFAHAFLSAGGQESDLMALAGWESAAMVRRYAKSAQQERAIDSHRKLGVADRL